MCPRASAPWSGCGVNDHAVGTAGPVEGPVATLAAGRDESGGAMTTKVQKSITVDVPVSMAYNQWTQFEEFPEFMGGVQKVEQLNDRRLRWVAEIAGVKREWHAEILEQRQDEKVAWAASEGATNAGAVTFAPNGAGRTLARSTSSTSPRAWSRRRVTRSTSSSGRRSP